MIDFTRWFKGFGADNELRFEFDNLKKEYAKLETDYKALAKRLWKSTGVEVECEDKVRNQMNEYNDLSLRYENSLVKIRELEDLLAESNNKKTNRRKKE